MSYISLDFHLISRWQNQVNDGSDIHVSHPVTNFEFLYEPFYIARDTVPPHDERFIGYGYTRNSQVRYKINEKSSRYMLYMFMFNTVC